MTHKGVLKKNIIKVVGVGNDCAASSNNVVFGERAELSERGRGPAAQLISIIYSNIDTTLVE